MKKILVCEDEAAIRDFVVINLTRAGYDVIEAENGDEALVKYDENNGDLDVAILDVMMPGSKDGFAVCKELRARNGGIGIIMLTARTQEMDKVTGLMLGADDYVTKPFSPSELVARVKSNIRRYTQLGNVVVDEDNIYRSGELVINDDNKEVTVEGELVKLTPIEYNILLLLVKNQGRVFSIDQIYENIWEEEAVGADNTVAVHIRHIREKIEINPKEPKYLKVVWGVGYKVEKL